MRKRTEFPPHVEHVEGDVHIQKADVVCWVCRDTPFGPDYKVVQPMYEGYTASTMPNGITIEHTIGPNEMLTLWEVLTYAIHELEPDWIAGKLSPAFVRILEGEQVAAQEAG